MNIEITQIVVALLISISGLVLATRFLKLHAFFALLFASMVYGVLVGMPFPEIINTMQSGFGSLLQQIGILIVLGSVLGMLLEKTGAMDIISQKLLSTFGSKRTVLAMSVIGALVGIPVFCDSGFIILSRLIPSLAMKASVNPATLSLSLSSGLYNTHTLVPPTPGPLAAAANTGMGEHLGLVMVMGMLVSVPVVLVSFLFSKKLGKYIGVHLNMGSLSSIETFQHGKLFFRLYSPSYLSPLLHLPN